MKIATEVLGGIVIALLIIAIIFTFVGAKSVIKTGSELSEGETGDVVGTLEALIALFISFFGVLYYYMVIIFGVVQILYLLAFGFSYYKLFTGHIAVQFNKWNGVIFGIVFFFSLILFICKPSNTWGIFVITLLLAGCGIAYSVLSSKLYSATLGDGEIGEFEDDAPQIVMGE